MSTNMCELIVAKWALIVLANIAWLHQDWSGFVWAAFAVIAWAVQWHFRVNAL